MTSIKVRAVAALFCIAATGSASGFNYDESIHGDLAGTLTFYAGLEPTVLTATPGINSIALGVTGTGDRDYFTFTVPTGHVLSSILHKTYESTDNLSFIGFQAGTQLTEPFSGANPGNLLGYMHFGPSAGTVGTDILDNLANSDTSSPAAIGFDAPVPAGPYAFWVQQTGVPAAYSFDFVITPVPEPEQWALMLGGIVLLAARVRAASRHTKVAV